MTKKRKIIIPIIIIVVCSLIIIGIYIPVYSISIGSCVMEREPETIRLHLIKGDSLENMQNEIKNEENRGLADGCSFPRHYEVYIF